MELSVPIQPGDHLADRFESRMLNAIPLGIDIM
jgi:hypothetical protein